MRIPMSYIRNTFYNFRNCTKVLLIIRNLISSIASGNISSHTNNVSFFNISITFIKINKTTICIIHDFPSITIQVVLLSEFFYITANISSKIFYTTSYTTLIRTTCFSLSIAHIKFIFCR